MGLCSALPGRSTPGLGGEQTGSLGEAGISANPCRCGAAPRAVLGWAGSEPGGLRAREPAPREPACTGVNAQSQHPECSSRGAREGHQEQRWAWGEGVGAEAGSCSPDVPASGCSTSSVSELHPGFVPPLHPPGVLVPTMGQEPCADPSEHHPSSPIPLPSSGVTVFCRMKFTIRILSKEEVWLKAAQGIWALVHYLHYLCCGALENQGGKGEGGHQNPGKEAGKQWESDCWALAALAVGCGGGFVSMESRALLKGNAGVGKGKHMVLAVSTHLVVTATSWWLSGLCCRLSGFLRSHWYCRKRSFGARTP